MPLAGRRAARPEKKGAGGLWSSSALIISLSSLGHLFSLCVLPLIVRVHINHIIQGPIYFLDALHLFDEQDLLEAVLDDAVRRRGARGHTNPRGAVER